ncbi:MAG: hypothetical protein AVDCRST_MAG18-4720, partial [uncultured Thermomicrobiales bacterium]
EATAEHRAAGDRGGACRAPRRVRRRGERGRRRRGADDRGRGDGGAGDRRP